MAATRSGRITRASARTQADDSPSVPLGRNDQSRRHPATVEAAAAEAAGATRRAASRRPAPAKEPLEGISQRRSVVLSFWAVILFLGLPLWYRTTTVHRAPLPYAEIGRLEDAVVRRPELPLAAVALAVDGGCALDAAGRAAAQAAANAALGGLVHVALGAPGARHTIACGGAAETVVDGGVVRLPAPSGAPDAVGAALAALFRDEAAALAAFLDERRPTSNLHDIKLTDDVHVSYTLVLPNDASAAVLAAAAAWPAAVGQFMARAGADAGAAEYLRVSFDSQVQFVGPLRAGELAPSELSNAFAEWDLGDHLPARLDASEDAPPTSVVQFVVYVHEHGGDVPPVAVAGSRSNSILVSNRGGVIVWNRPAGAAADVAAGLDRAVFPVFARLFERLLSPLPPGVAGRRAYRVAGPPRLLDGFTADRYGRVLAYRSLVATSRTLASLSHVVTALPNVAIPPGVAALIAAAIARAHAAAALLRAPAAAGPAAVRAAGAAGALADRAFFDSRMVQSMFVPTEHKIAVYLPLLGPITIPLLVGLRKVVGDLRAAQ
ncbi:phosphatidylinositol-glycan biosynthesis class S protein-domain-containing protein [Dipodascopsis tothii]|uniref:phosphatidylinositol-glycan biosynthesis class S protein-domain-containing protein n=1 Tax=Dipodascopsis tothii TaxID=44089 RepID=UPI0034CD1562